MVYVHFGASLPIPLLITVAWTVKRGEAREKEKQKENRGIRGEREREKGRGRGHLRGSAPPSTINK